MMTSLADLPQLKQEDLKVSSETGERLAEPVSFVRECPVEHHLSYLSLMATNRCDLAFGDIFPMETQRQKDLFELLDYAYIGARYDPEYKITKEELEQLALCVKKLHEVTERICAAKIESLA